MHKDLSDVVRGRIDDIIGLLVCDLYDDNQSLGLAREHVANAFDKAAAELENAPEIS